MPGFLFLVKKLLALCALSRSFHKELFKEADLLEGEKEWQ